MTLAAEPPPLVVDSRTHAVERYVNGLRQSLEAHPQGWGGGSDDEIDLPSRVRSRLWYHTIELPGGVVTPGAFDHRPLVPHYGIPEKLDGKRVLDVGTWDGFWAFEFERRGGVVVAVDVDQLSQIDLPPPIREAVRALGLDQRMGGGFELARDALGSTVERVALSIYDLDPTGVGSFDLVHVGDVLQHLEAPSRALRSVRSVTRGLAIISISFDPSLGDEPLMRYRGGWKNAVWWNASLGAIGQMIVDAGFTEVSVRAAYRIRGRTGGPSWQVVLHARP